MPGMLAVAALAGSLVGQDPCAGAGERGAQVREQLLHLAATAQPAEAGIVARLVDDVGTLRQCRRGGAWRGPLDSVVILLSQAEHVITATRGPVASTPAHRRALLVRITFPSPNEDDASVIGHLGEIERVLGQAPMLEVGRCDGSVARLALGDGGRTPGARLDPVDNSALGRLHRIGLALRVVREAYVPVDSSCGGTAGADTGRVSVAHEWRMLMVRLATAVVRLEEPPPTGRRVPGLFAAGFHRGTVQLGGVARVAGAPGRPGFYVGAVLSKVDGRPLDRGAVLLGRNLGRWVAFAGPDWGRALGAQVGLWLDRAGGVSPGVTVSTTGGIGVVLVSRL